MDAFPTNPVDAGGAADEPHVEKNLRERMAQAEPSMAKRLAVLAEAGRVLSSSLDYEATLRRVARLVATAVADYCIIDLVGDDGTIRRVATASQDPELEDLIASLRRFPPDPQLSDGVPRVLLTGEPLLLENIDDELLRHATRSQEHFEVVQRLGVRSMLIVPLKARNRILGAISLGCTHPDRVFEDGDLALAEELAGHAALALDNARLHREAQLEIAERRKAQEELELESSLLQLLLDVTIAANEASTFRTVLMVALDSIRTHTGWPVGHAWLPAADGYLEPTDLWSIDDPERFAALRHATAEVSLPFGIGLPGRVLATGRPVAVVDVVEDPSFLRASEVKDVGVKAAFAFPVLVGTETVAVLEFFSGRAVEPNPQFLEVMSHVGMQLGRVAERERAEAAVREGESRFRQLAENIRDVFWISDARSERMLYVSPAYHEIWGRPVETVYAESASWLEGVHPDDRDRVRSTLAAVAGEEYEMEYRVVRPDQTVRWVKARGFPVADEEGEVFRIVGIAEDVTEQKQIEGERSRLLSLEKDARRAAEDAVNARDEIVRMAAHDLKNPIHTIKLAAGLIAEVHLSEEQRAEQLEVIRRTADHMDRLVRGLLDLKRIEAGHGLPVDPEPTEVRALLARSHSLFEAQAEAKGIEIVREQSEDDLDAMADRDRILQVLWNLTGNAIKFTPEGGRVFIRATGEPEEVVFSVSDTGPGVPEEAMERLFDPFWQEKRTARLGTGLGLPISKAIVEAHGGRIWLESEMGRGTTFRFTLPRA